ncbi:hypothetical protein ACJQWK_09461 [Exserohilum turcicum]|uniref:Uncharacterized protein n=1 Tax=Exserohilum turcicum (strain 28A) TaxID=671987 RepID=R0IX25_EXST2|nr:uncharacterized protein SETTUDRAFT_167845 [Exserohilum turcica Et28A]EOA89330.1 hypothetical protein SETTUDRAFT_167845 [Exserohilum turcica Et28A]
MLFTKVAFVSALAALAAAQDTSFNTDKVPSACKDTCSKVGDITKTCKNDHNNDASAALKCICTSTDANSIIPDCEACIRSHNDNKTDGNDADAYRLLTECSYTTTTLAASQVAKTTVTDTTTSTDVTTTHHKTSNPAPMKTAGAAVGIGAFGIAALGLL